MSDDDSHNSNLRVARRVQFKTDIGKNLRANATEAEKKLWSILRNKQVGGHRFRRQHPMGPYIVDFYCPAAKLVVELDDSQHGDAENVAYDIARTKWLEARGCRVMRFTNADFLRERAATVDVIFAAAESLIKGSTTK